MPAEFIFISHASADDRFVAELRWQLEAHKLPVWVDSRKLRGGSVLAREIEQAIEDARQFIVVLSPDTVNSDWVRREVRKALEVAKRRSADGYRVIPLLLPGMRPTALSNWFDEEPVGIPVAPGADGLAKAILEILAALHERVPSDAGSPEPPRLNPLSELVLKLTDARLDTRDGKRRVAATATLIYTPAAYPASPRVESRRFSFTAPLGPIEADDLRWYLESYYLWPVGVFLERAEGIAKKLPQWGKDLFNAAIGERAAWNAFAAWQHAADGGERRFSVEVDSELPGAASPEAQAAAREAGAELLALPWELLHDDHGWLFHGNNAVRVRRRLPNRRALKATATQLPIRILLVSPRPEDEAAGYIDHRVSARPLMDAVDELGELVVVTVLTPPTVAALERALQAASDAGKPFDVVHFDGHGVYDKNVGLGALCFEHPDDLEKLEKRKHESVDAERLAGIFRDHRVPLVFLEACQSAAEENPTASVAAKVLQEGVTSVVAMSHSVLVETARRFVKAFYEELAHGSRVGRAMLKGQQALFADTARGKIMGAGELRLQDWFVPVIYQEEQDPQLITKTLPDEVKRLAERKRRLSLGKLPDAPPHQFRGRSRELLALERLLQREPWAVVRGIGGAGKTTLAAELARWLVRIGRFAQAAWVSLEHHRDARAVLDELGRQLLPEADKYSVAQYPDLKQALQPVERALRDHPTIIVLDNCESILPDPRWAKALQASPSESDDATDKPATTAATAGKAAGPTAQEPYVEMFALCRQLLGAEPRTRLVFTSRESLPAPFAHARCERELGALDRRDAIELVSQVMKDHGWTPEERDPGRTPQEVEDLVDAVHCHARALTLLARELVRTGVTATTANLRDLMADLERKHPGDRENSLYASVELSLRRLSPDAREHVKALAVCHGGVHLGVLQNLTGLTPEDVRRLNAELISVGLGEDMGCGHLRLGLGLREYLAGELTNDEFERIRALWTESMSRLTEYIYNQSFKIAQIAARLTNLELPNLLEMLENVRRCSSPERVATLASRVEHLVSEIGQSAALGIASRFRREAAGKLSDWGYSRFGVESSEIDRLLENGEIAIAKIAAQRLFERCLAAGEAAYVGAPYHIAVAHFVLGRVLRLGGSADDALGPLDEAKRRLQQLAVAGDPGAEHMTGNAFGEIGDCLRELGRLDEAAKAYEEAMKRARLDNRSRDIAASVFQLGTLRMLQKRFPEALALYCEARDSFEGLGEPRQVATTWHHIGLVHHAGGQFQAAEEAYRRALRLNVQNKSRPGEAGSLNQLGNLYGDIGHDEDAVTFYRNAADCYVRLEDLAGEGIVRSNAARMLIKLGRYDEARSELLRAIECKKTHGLAAELWKVFSVLENLECATGHPGAALAAREESIQTYLAYRRAGGVSQTGGVQLFDLAVNAVKRNNSIEARQRLAKFPVGADTPNFVKALIPKLDSFLAGDRNPDLAADPELDYRDAAELQLLLESLPPS